eukprot:6063310-Amphidinium_carterae.1
MSCFLNAWYADRGHEVDEDEMNEDGLVEDERVVEPPASKALTQPIKPTEEMIRNHSVSHIPFRNWCAPYVLRHGQGCIRADHVRLNILWRRHLWFHLTMASWPRIGKSGWLMKHDSHRRGSTHGEPLRTCGKSEGA